ncbi:unnamed protein product [Fraxinus pennsylvanica]|uniref:Phosphatidate cytidylyltransferase, mitochondrial n=1 Tax=Fraxinus pennsylvanica TaxID=56036 RepID=A0AAD2EBU5_9LAMI|nr:unnamed protein product [Fraxinus pennsylvanica]
MAPSSIQIILTSWNYDSIYASIFSEKCMERAKFTSFDFCCMYGSALLPNNLDKIFMIDYFIGVQNPQQWHTENQYASWMVHLGRQIINVGVHFNPFVDHSDKMFKCDKCTILFRTF